MESGIWAGWQEGGDDLAALMAEQDLTGLLAELKQDEQALAEMFEGQEQELARLLAELAGQEEENRGWMEAAIADGERALARLVEELAGDASGQSLRDLMGETLTAARAAAS